MKNVLYYLYFCLHNLSTYGFDKSELLFNAKHIVEQYIT